MGRDVYLLRLITHTRADRSRADPVKAVMQRRAHFEQFSITAEKLRRIGGAAQPGGFAASGE